MAIKFNMIRRCDVIRVDLIELLRVNFEEAGLGLKNYTKSKWAVNRIDTLVWAYPLRDLELCLP